jgi:hypothetical protein
MAPLRYVKVSTELTHKQLLGATANLGEISADGLDSSAKRKSAAAAAALASPLRPTSSKKSL